MKPARSAEAEQKKLHQEREVILTEIVDDLYKKRKRLYHVNFFRGVFFGFGSALGGTVVVAVLLWVLSWFVDWPLIGQVIESLKK